MANYKSSFTNGAAVDAALNAATSHKANHKSGGSDYIRIDELAAPTDTTTLNVSTSAHGLCPKGEGTGTKFLKDDLTWDSVTAGSVTYGTTAGTACEGNDTRLSDDRDPNTHATSHKDGGTDYIRLDELAAATTDARNATTSNPGLCPAGEGTGTKYLKDDLTWDTPAGGDGSGITLPGSASVYYNGLGGWGTPVASGSTFKPWITVGAMGSGADYICDGTADNVEIQSALNAVKSGGTVAFLSGNYNLAARVYQSAKNIHLIGFGTVTFTINIGTDSPAFYFYGSMADTETLTSNATMGSDTIVVGSVANVQAGDLIKITNSTSWSDDGDSQKTGETYTCYSVDSSTNTITLDQGLLRAYTTAASSVARIYRPVKISVDNLEFNHYSATGSYQGLQLKYARDCEVQNCTFRNCGMSAISLYTCYNVDVGNNNIYDCRLAGYGYGVVIVDATAFVNIHDNHIDRCRHTVAAGTSDYIGLNRGIKIHHNVLIGGNFAGCYVIDSHRNSIDYTVTENYIVVSSGNVGFSDGTKNSIFANNYVYGGGVAAAAYEKNGEIEGGRYMLSGNQVYDITLNRDNGANLGKSMTIVNNHVYNSPSYGIAINAEIYEQITITGNTIEDCASEGICYYLPASATVPGNIIISNNNLNSIGRNGIYIRNYNTTKKIRGVISGNVINGVDTVSDSCSGIHLYNVTSTAVTGNTVYDDTGGMHAAIAEDTGCDYNNINGNVTGGGSYHVVIVGGNTNNTNNVDV